MDKHSSHILMIGKGYVIDMTDMKVVWVYFRAGFVYWLSWLSKEIIHSWLQTGSSLFLFFKARSKVMVNGKLKTLS